MMMHQFQDWISILGHNLGVHAHFCTKFGNRAENQQRKSEIRFSKTQDEFRLWAIILASINIFNKIENLVA